MKGLEQVEALLREGYKITENISYIPNDGNSTVKMKKGEDIKEIHLYGIVLSFDDVTKLNNEK
ncbi:hypothetical protein [Rhodopseudomonas parapalustris]